MTSANACRPRLVGRPRGIIPAPTASGVQAWGLLLAGLQSHEPCSTTAGSTHLSLGFIDDHAAASPSSFRPAKENTRTITRREFSPLFPTADTRSRDYCSNFPRELHVVHKASFRFPRKLYVTAQNTLFFSFSLFYDTQILELLDRPSIILANDHRCRSRGTLFYRILIDSEDARADHVLPVLRHLSA